MGPYKVSNYSTTEGEKGFGNRDYEATTTHSVTLSIDATRTRRAPHILVSLRRATTVYGKAGYRKMDICLARNPATFDAPYGQPCVTSVWA